MAEARGHPRALRRFPPPCRPRLDRGPSTPRLLDSITDGSGIRGRPVKPGDDSCDGGGSPRSTTRAAAVSTPCRPRPDRGPSTPRPFDSIASFSGILGRPVEPGDDSCDGGESPPPPMRAAAVSTPCRPRLHRGPSTLRLLGSIADASGILGRPVIGERKRRRPSDGYAGR
jgi:hypothetical protein